MLLTTKNTLTTKSFRAPTLNSTMQLSVSMFTVTTDRPSSMLDLKTQPPSLRLNS